MARRSRKKLFNSAGVGGVWRNIAAAELVKVCGGDKRFAGLRCAKRQREETGEGCQELENGRDSADGKARSIFSPDCSRIGLMRVPSQGQSFGARK